MYRKIPFETPSGDPVKRIEWAFPGLFVLLWSTGFIGAKLGLPYAEPATFLLVRFSIVVAILLPVCWLARAPWPRAPRDAVHMGVAGVMLQAGYLGGVFASIHHGMPAGVSALIAGLQPVLTALLSARMLGERTNLRQWAGLGNIAAVLAFLAGTVAAVAAPGREMP